MADDIARLETVIVNRFEATAIDAVVAIRNVKAFKAALVGAIASEINGITAKSIACEVAAIVSIVAQEEGSGSLIDLILGHFRKAPTTPPRYIPLAAIAPAVEAALSAFTAETIDPSSEWSGNTIDFTDW